MKYITKYIEVSEVTKITLTALVFTALTLAGSISSVSASELRENASDESMFESREGEDPRDRETSIQNNSHELVLFQAHFSDPRGNMVDVFVDPQTGEVTDIDEHFLSGGFGQ